jgi:spore coat polysaccharide biosynthesis protein SpsF
MKIDAIIQARMDSTRLPGKVLMKLNGISILQCLFEQLNSSISLNQKILATTINKSDDIISNFANLNDLELFRGNSSDVLDRFYQCAKQFKIKHIVRITSDCPLIDPEIIDKTIQKYKTGRFDYVNNFYKKRYPYGSEVEVFSFETLEKTWKEANHLSEREHVTPFIYNNPNRFSIGHIEPSEDYSHLHWAVDRIGDLKFVKMIYERIKTKPVHLLDILKVIEDDPSILTINRDSVPDEGYKRSLKNDKMN